MVRPIKQTRQTMPGRRSRVKLLDTIEPRSSFKEQNEICRRWQQYVFCIYTVSHGTGFHCAWFRIFVQHNIVDL